MLLRHAVWQISRWLADSRFQDRNTGREDIARCRNVITAASRPSDSCAAAGRALDTRSRVRARLSPGLQLPWWRAAVLGPRGSAETSPRAPLRIWYQRHEVLQSEWLHHGCGLFPVCVDCARRAHRRGEAWQVIDADDWVAPAYLRTARTLRRPSKVFSPGWRSVTSIFGWRGAETSRSISFTSLVRPR